MAAFEHSSLMDINSKAIASLLQGEHTKCMMALKFALQSFRTDISTCAFDQSKISRTIRTVALPSTQEACDGTFALFHGVFVFLDEDEDDVEDFEQVDHHFIPAVLLYNMGVCYHQETMRRPGFCSVGLDMARNCYGHALTLLEGFSQELRQTDMLLPAALTNNQAHIAAHLMDTKCTQIFCKMLSDILDYADLDDQIQLEEDEEAHVFFSLNVMLVSELNIHGIAPAA